ncbi:MAG: hypothetical protein IJH64_09420 [Oscillospiraceae bacterium]|nr:hypothetical protein [Oscillospiraceae bacterium]
MGQNKGNFLSVAAYFLIQQAPPEKESIRKKLRDMETEAKRRDDARRQQPRPRSHDYDRGR